MKILFIGDVVGSPGRFAIKTLLPALKKEFGLDFVVANAENAAGGSGITLSVADDLFASGVDALTSGDHIWKKKEIFELINREKRILRPINFPAMAPGKGSEIFQSKSGQKIGVMCQEVRTLQEGAVCLG